MMKEGNFNKANIKGENEIKIKAAVDKVMNEYVNGKNERAEGDINRILDRVRNIDGELGEIGGIIEEHDGDVSFMGKLRKGVRGKFRTIVASLVFILNTIGAKAAGNEKVESNLKPGMEKEIFTDADEKVSSEAKVLTKEDFIGSDKDKKGEKTHEGMEKTNTLDITESFPDGVGRLNKEQGERLKETINEFLNSLSEEQLHRIFSGEEEIVIRPQTSDKPVRLIEDPLFKDGVRNNEQLAEVRGEDAAYYTAKAIEKFAKDIGYEGELHLNMDIVIPHISGKEIGVGEDNKRKVTIEIESSIRKDNVIEKFKNNLDFIIVDRTGSTDEDRLTIDKQIEEVKKVNPDVKVFDLKYEEREFEGRVAQYEKPAESLEQALDYLKKMKEDGKKLKGMGLIVGVDETSTDNFNDRYYPKGGIKKVQENRFNKIKKGYDSINEKVIAVVPKMKGSESVSVVNFNKHYDLYVVGEGSKGKIFTDAREGSTEAGLALKAAKLDEGRSISYELKNNGDVVIKHVNLNNLIDRYEVSK